MTPSEVKSALVTAHREENWEVAKELSQLRQKLKKKRYCIEPGCAVRICSGDRCRMHEKRHRFYSKKLKAV